MKKFLKNAIIMVVMSVMIGVVFAFTFDALQEEQEEVPIKVESQTTLDDSIASINQSKKAVFSINVKSDEWGSDMVNISSGSGVLYKEDDTNYYIITNHHVIKEAGKVCIKVNEKEVEVDLIGSDADTDIAVLKLDKSTIKQKLVVPAIRDVDTLKTGENVFAIGNALGYGKSITKGIISAVQRDFDNRSSKFSYNLIQTDAAINPGNSGGALVDARGNIIGINVLKIASNGVEGMGFAIPIKAATDISNVILTKGYLPKAYLGVVTQDLDLDILAINKIPKGVLVARVLEGTPAYEAGIVKNDLIIKLNDKEIHNSMELGYEVRKRNHGDEITLEVFRDYKIKSIKIKLSQTSKE